MVFKKINAIKKGFTLVELIVVIAIITILLTATFFVVNPYAQIEKGQDARRLSDLKTIKESLDVYFHDNDQFPLAGAITFGSSFGTYLQKVPNDPRGSSWSNYLYFTDSSATKPQWFVVFARLSQYAPTSNVCTLACKPASPAGAKWACSYSGMVACPGPTF